MTHAPNPWLRSYPARPNAPTRLVIFPHGGGSASFYRSLARAIGEHVDAVVVQYPGREDRLGEPHIDAMAPLARGVAAALRKSFDRPIAFFGHSMGASVAHEVSRRLERDVDLSPDVLVVSGRPGPSRQKPGAKHLDDEQLWDDVRRLGGTDRRLIDQPEIRAMVLPTLRADYRLVETYRPPLSADLRTAVTACIGAQDPEVTVEDATTWRDATTGPFDLAVFPGDHFYLRSPSEDAVADWLSALGEQLLTNPAVGSEGATR
jgi:pyochelin biosynthetic protein PchC